MRRAFGAVLALTLLTTLAAAGGNPVLPWLRSENEAVAQATATGKPILLYLHADYCTWCKMMEQGTFRDSRVQALAEEYALCKLDGEREGKGLIKKFKVEKYPFDAVLDASENLIAAAPDYLDGDKYARVMATNLPADSVARLEKVSGDAANADSSRARVALVLYHAERDETGAAATVLASLPASADPNLITAANHDLGLAYARKGDFASAAACFQKAIATAADPRETALLHIALADCWLRLDKKPEAVAELTLIEKSREATKDEKKDAKKKREALTRK